MDSNTSVAIMFACAFGATAFIISSILNYRLKTKMIGSGVMDNETVQLLNQLNTGSRRSALKWALLLLSGGLGLVLLQFLRHDLDSPLPYGIEAIFISAGLFSFYFLTSSKASV